MELHGNAALSLNKRRLLCRRVVVERWTLTQAAAAAEVSVRCARKWVGRYRAEGELGLLDRSSAPARVANRTPDDRVEAIAALRRLRFTGPEIAELLSMALSTVSGILTRIGMGRLGRLGLEPARRYERARPGELVHVDVKKLGRIERGAGKRITGVKHNPLRTRVDAAGIKRKIIGWEYVHIAIDDCTRLAYAEVLPDEKATTAIAFLRRAVAFFERHGVQVERLLTDNGSAYRSTVHALACRALGIRHLRTRPYRPQTNGKAERFIRTLLGGWAYGAIYRTSSERTAALDGWLWHYNHQPDTQPSATSPRSPASTSEPTRSGLTASGTCQPRGLARGRPALEVAPLRPNCAEVGDLPGRDSAGLGRIMKPPGSQSQTSKPAISRQNRKGPLGVRIPVAGSELSAVTVAVQQCGCQNGRARWPLTLRRRTAEPCAGRTARGPALGLPPRSSRGRARLARLVDRERLPLPPVHTP